MEKNEKQGNDENLNKKDNLVKSAVEASKSTTRLSKIDKQRNIIEEAMKLRKSMIEAQRYQEEYIPVKKRIANENKKADETVEEDIER